MSVIKKWKIAWVTPFSQRSSIGEFSHTLLESFNLKTELINDFEITIFSNVNGPNYATHLNIVDLNEKHIEEIGVYINQFFDVVIYNFGNNTENHGLIFELLEHCKGIAILHDVVYQHYFANFIFERLNSPIAYAYLMGEHYGFKGLNAVKISNVCTKTAREYKYGIWDSDASMQFPLIEEIASNRNIIATVVNSKYTHKFIKKIRKPNLILRLPGDEKHPVQYKSIINWAKQTRTRKIVSIASFGHIQRGKQLDYVINTIAKSIRLREIINFTIAGRPSDQEYVQELTELISSQGLTGIVSFKFNLTSSELLSLKENSDFFVNLRYPNTEGGSGSLIEQLAAGKPVIALRSGCYAEIKAGVVFIDSLSETESLEAIIYKLAVDADYRVTLGLAAYTYALSFTSENYIKRVLNFGIKNIPNNTDLVSDTIINLKLDPQINNPKPFIFWKSKELSKFLEVILDFDKSPVKAINYLLNLRKSNLNNAIDLYHTIRSANFILQKEVENGIIERWRLTEKINFDFLVFISHFENRYFFQYLALAIAEKNIDIFNKILLLVNSRIEIKDFFGRFSFVLAIIDILLLKNANESEINSVNREQFQMLLGYGEEIRKICSLSETDFNKLVVSLGPNFFSSYYYKTMYPDVESYISASSFEDNNKSNLFEHFKNHGIIENRSGKVTFHAVTYLQKHSPATVNSCFSE